MNQEAEQNYKLSDKELNKIYQELMKILRAEEKQLLIKAQKEWVKFRDLDCEFEIQKFEGGSI